MISKDLIQKSINNAIIKCSQRLTLNVNVKRTLNTFAKKTRGRKTEKGILVDDEGNELFSKTGNKDRINWEMDLENTYEDNDYKPYHLDHNHPNKYGSTFPTSLSEADFQRLMDKHVSLAGDNGYMCKSVTAEDSSNHSRMTIIRGDNFDKDGSENDIDKYMSLIKGLDNIWFDYNNKYENVRNKKFKEYWGEGDNRHSLNTKEDFELFDKLQQKASDEALKEIGLNDYIKKLKGDFRKINCNLIFEWVED